jgi:long-chain acyl-CoA synthetase
MRSDARKVVKNQVFYGSLYQQMDQKYVTRAPEVQELVQAEMDRVNAKFARVEQIKKFFLLDRQLSAEDEELTPTMKLKRKLVEKKYADQIEAMYK